MSHEVKISCTIVGSFSDIDFICKIREKLRNAGYHIVAPNEEFFELKTHAIKEHHSEARDKESEYFAQRKALSIMRYFKYIEDSDFVYAVNEKDGEEYYGLNTSMEIGVALYLGKPVVLHRSTTRAELRVLTIPCKFLEREE